MERNIGIPPDHYVHKNEFFPMSDTLPAGAWHITDVIRELHRRGIDGGGPNPVRVAVNDTAGEANHPFLAKQIAGKDFTGSAYGLQDRQGHGTHCQGIVKSMLPKCNLICAKVLGDGGSGSTTGINAGRVWAAQQGADIISESLGDTGGPPIKEDLDAYDKAYALGVSICNAALGNSGNQGIGRPGSYFDHNHGIAALNQDWKTIAPFSSVGPQARFAAPGVNIISCKPGGGWVRMDGTSMATPCKSGGDGLVICWRRKLGMPDLRGPREWANFYVSNGLIVDIGSPGWDNKSGNGLVDYNKVFNFLLDNTSL